ncbi:transcriptional regulator [Geomonas limicola]|uniref:Transcriptional regulator n=1 Tax=Geomonas limicola TaxID=2740186 RepID=A0A6V8N6Q9_9BACT|nr:ANTAR domain-containing protein [Geomonas limicola]GFO68256.1 transcriptional regulator [Geomonas limicola]
MRKTVLCIHDEGLLGSLKKRLTEQGCAEIIVPASLEELSVQALASHPEAIVLEYPASEPATGTTVKRLWDQLGVPIVLLAESSEIEAVERWGEGVLSTILTKPVREDELMAALRLSVAAARRVEELKGEISSLKESIETRKVVEKAKGRLMERDRLSEAEAFRRMQRLAMDRRISMRQLAEAILLTDRIGG